MAEYEKVIELIGYYDGPRQGVADYRGQAHVFKSRMLDVFGDDDIVDIFELFPVDSAGPTVLATAEFRRIGTGPVPQGEWPLFEVCWRPKEAN